jgi:hypothetical protein
VEEQIQELYGEGLASHTDPESCVASREAGGEALTGAPCGGRRVTGVPAATLYHLFPLQFFRTECTSQLTGNLLPAEKQLMSEYAAIRLIVLNLMRIRVCAS